MRAVLPESLEAAARAGRNAVLDVLAKNGGTPLRDGDMVTLVYGGVADGVALRHWLDIYPPIPEFTRIDDTDLWSTTFRVPAEARIEYKIAVTSHGRQRLKPDPFNPERAPNAWGINSELRGAAYEPPPWTHLDPDAAKGTVTRHEITSAAFSDERVVHIYQPAASEAQALLVVHDGNDYLEFAGFTRVLDNLIAAGEIPPVAAVLCDPVDRLAEYRASQAHASFLVDEVLPFAAAEIGSCPAIAMGASLGGVASLHAAWMNPGVFAALILQAGSFVSAMGGPHGRGPVFGPVIRFMRRFTATPGVLPPLVHVSCGRFDGLINEARTMAGLLGDCEVDVALAESDAGHDWRAWRDLLRPALIHVLNAEEAIS